MTPEALAQIAYEAWCNAWVWSQTSPPFRAVPPRWNDLERDTQAAWHAAAIAVKANVLSGFTKVGEGESSV